MSTTVKELIFTRVEGLITFPTMAVLRMQMPDVPQDPIELLESGITHWVHHTDEGRVAFEQSGEDFNIGDLYEHWGWPGLKASMNTVGVVLLSLDVSSVEDTYSFDRILARPEN